MESKQCRGVRGATTVPLNDRTLILGRTRELLLAMAEANDMEVEDIASIFFTTTRDLNAEYPALAARELGWYDHALLCAHEIQVPGSLDRCVRVLLHWNTAKPLTAIKHVYIRGAESLRPERSLPPALVAEHHSEGGSL